MLREALLYVVVWMGFVCLLWCHKRYLEWRDGEGAVKTDTQRRLNEAVARHNRYFERWLAPRKRKGPR